MAWVAVNKDGQEICSEYPIYRLGDFEWTTLSEEELKDWCFESNGNPDDFIVKLPKGSIKKLIGRDLTWKDDAVELKDGQNL